MSAAVAQQAQKEYVAGYRYGIEGGSEPKPDKGKAFWLGWWNGKDAISTQHNQGGNHV